MILLDLFAGRLGWSKAFLERGWGVVAYDIVLPSVEIPEGVDYRLQDILTLTIDDIRAINPDFIVASSPCQEFSCHRMKHFQPNAPYPEMGIKLFNYTREICEGSGVPYLMENVAAAKAFIGKSVHHCGPFHLWGTAVPPLMPQGITKAKWTMHKNASPSSTARPGNWCPEVYMSRKKRSAIFSTIPNELASTVADYAERIIS